MRESETLKQLLGECAGLIADRFADRSRLSIATKKGVADLVTEADLAVQHHIEAAIAREFPGDVLVGEESGRDSTPDDPDARCWVCDPIDGTHNFARGMVAGWGISVAFVEGGTPRAGGVAMPGLGELFLAAEGHGATRNGRAIKVSQIDDLAAARVEADLARPSDRDRTLGATAHALRHAGQIRCHGASVVGLCSVACGSAEAYIHGGLHPWDFAAAMLVIREAGGRVTRFDGKDARVFDGQLGIAATNGVIHETVLNGINAANATHPDDSAR